MCDCVSCQTKTVRVLPDLLDCSVLPRPAPSSSIPGGLLPRFAGAVLSKDTIAALPGCFSHVLATVKHGQFDDGGKHMVVQFLTKL